MQQVIYLEKEDELAAVRYLLEGAQARRILLVLPKKSELFGNPLALKILRRYASELALQVALVSSDARTRQLAHAEGVPAFSSIRLAEWTSWRMRAPQVSSAGRAAIKRVRALESGRGDPGYRDRIIVWSSRILGALLFLLLLAIVLAIAALTVPEARVTVVPFREVVDVTLQLKADPQVEKASLESRVIPARVVEVTLEDSGETATVAKKDAPDAPAGGAVTFVNQVAEPREILPGALVRTSTGTTVRFRTVTTATLDARIGASAVAEVEALEPGPVGNVPALTINTVETSALRGKVRVINEQPTTGGSVTQVGVVTRADKDRVSAQLLQRMQQKAFERLQSQLEENEFLPAESMTVEIIAETFDPEFLEAEADVLRLTMRIEARGIAVSTAYAELLAVQALETQIPETFGLNSEDIHFAVDPDVEMDGWAVLLDATASAELVVDLEPSEVRSAVKGLEVDDAVRALQREFALEGQPVVEVGPEWIKRWEWLDRVPRLGYRIQVIVSR